MKKVLVAIDDDHFGNLIADFVCEHHWQAGTCFRLLTVLPWMPPEKELRESLDLQHYVESTKKKRKALLDEFCQRIKKSNETVNCEVEHEMLPGNIAETILQVAESWPADLLIVGSHGRKGVSLFLMGSVSAAVVSHAPCSVIVIRPDQVTSSVVPALSADATVT